MRKNINRGMAVVMTAVTAVLLVMGLASAASAHTTGTGAQVHDDAAGNHQRCASAGNARTIANPSTTEADTTCSAAHSATHPGTGTVDPVKNDAPADAVVVIRDYGLENAPIIVGVIGAIFLVGLTFYLIRRGLMKARGAMRL